MNQNKALSCRVREGWGSVYEWGRTATLLWWGESRAWRWASDSLASLHSYPHPSPADVGNDRKNKIKDTIYRNELWLKSVRPQPQMETRTRSYGCKRIFYTRLYNLGGGCGSRGRKGLPVIGRLTDSSRSWHQSVQIQNPKLLPMHPCGLQHKSTLSAHWEQKNSI